MQSEAPFPAGCKLMFRTAGPNRFLMVKASRFKISGGKSRPRANAHGWRPTAEIGSTNLMQVLCSQQLMCGALR